MADEREEYLCNLDSVEEKRNIQTRIGTLRGRWWVRLERWHKKRSTEQNAWYHACIVRAFWLFLKEQDYNIVRQEDAHRMLARKFLTIEVVNQKTGEIIGKRVRSTTKLSTLEMADYCERCRAYLAEMFSIVVPDPDPAWRENAERKSA